jgi:hypothetical protein
MYRGPAFHRTEAYGLLGVNEWHGSRYWSLVQVAGLCRSYEVDAGRRGCCIYLLYRLVLLHGNNLDQAMRLS